MSKAEVTYSGLLDMQVCVPEDWTDEDVVRFAQRENPCGTTHGWQIRTHEASQPDYQTRVRCASRPACVHVMLDA